METVTKLFTKLIGQKISTFFLTPCDIPEALKGYGTVITMYPQIIPVIIQLLNLGSEIHIHKIMKMIEEIAHADVTRTYSSQWKISRLSGQIEKILFDLIICTDASKSDIAYTEKMIAETDSIPMLKCHLENILHNHILQMTM